jgi:hypothetical protein
LDDAELAVQELNEQLSKINLRKNSAGIVTTHAEFINTGIYAEIARAVPFPLVGATTIANTANGKMDSFMCNIMVLTGDDCEFAAGVSGSMANPDDEDAVMRVCYNETSAQLAGDVKVAFLYVPFKEARCTGGYIKTISDINPEAAVFGHVACSDMNHIEADNKTLCGDADFKDNLTLLLVSGNIQPRFYMSLFTRDSVIMPNIGEVTAAKDNIVLEINDINARQFLEGIGFDVKRRFDTGLITCAFIIDEKDKAGNIISTAARSLFAINDNGGTYSAVVPVGVTLSLAAATKDVVTNTTTSLIAEMKEQGKGNTLILYSCIARRFALLDERDKEYETINKCLEGSGMNYIAAYACGEICPVTTSEGVRRNDEHNYTIIACVL